MITSFKTRSCGLLSKSMIDIHVLISQDQQKYREFNNILESKNGLLHKNETYAMLPVSFLKENTQCKVNPDELSKHSIYHSVYKLDYNRYLISFKKYTKF